jgi:hypothetical protein
LRIAADGRWRSGGFGPEGRGRKLGIRQVLAIVLALGAALASCRPAPEPQSFRGIVTEVQPRDLGHAATVTVRGENGEQVQFKVAESVLFTPGHLREHLIFAEPVTVTYVETEAGKLATEITD